jgi:hydroxymethylpyrimidine pyrophosphatase-like HAD family hydrolase
MICVDLDGTAVDSDRLHAWFSEDVAEALNAAVRRGAVWCTNSGRHAHNQFGMIQACRALEVLPVAILAGERYIYDVNPITGTMRSREPYNQRAKHKSLELSPRVQGALAPQLRDLEAAYGVAEYFPAAEYTGWLLEPGADAVAFAAAVRTHLAAMTEAQVLRNGAWVLVIPAEFGKGRVLADLAAGLGVGREYILALGDQHNDLDMLEGRHAGHVGCPADADPEVRQTIRAARGWVAGQPGSSGTAGLIRRFTDLVMCQRLPEQ